MYKLVIMAVVVALLSGCGSYPRYSVAKGFENSKFSLMTPYKVKRSVDADLAEDGREWNKNGLNPPHGECVLRRENKSPPTYQSKEDIGCAVWDATDKRASRIGPF